MYSQIMVPVDLAHLDRLEKALTTASDLSKHYDAPICYVGVTPTTPGPLGHNPAEFAQKLEAFGAEQAATRGHKATTKAYPSHDVAIDLDDILLKAVDEVGADLVVMASHVPGVLDYVWPSHGGKVAAHSDASVLVVR